MRWVGPQARPLLTVEDETPPAHALQVLEKELNAPRRFVGGAVAIAALLLAGVAAAAAGAVTGVRDGVPAVLLLGLLALVLGSVAVWTGWGVVAAGRLVVSAYVDWSRRDSGLSTRPAGMLQRAFAGAWILREVLAAASFLATAFAGVVLVLPLVGDADRDSVLIGLALGGAGVIGFGIATWCLLATDLRAVRAHGARTGRGHEARRGTRA